MKEFDFLVTGASGFAGSHTVDLLVSQGKRIRVFIRDQKRAAEFTSRGIDVVVGDIADPVAVGAATKGVATVLHIAALFRQAGLPASEFHRVNVEGTRNVFERSIEAGVHKVIHCSTVGVMGHIENPPATEHTPYSPGDPYQSTKMEGEKLALEFYRAGKIKGSVIRPAMIYGPGDSRTLKLFKPIAEGKFFYVGPGDASVHFVDVRDVARSFLLAAESDSVDGEIFIIAGETRLPLKKLAGIISDLMGVREPWLHLPIKPMQSLGSVCEAVCTPLRINPPIFRRRVDFFTKHRAFDISKAREKLGFAPQQSLVEELLDIITSYLETGAISPARVKRPSVIVRSLEGEIRHWEDKNGAMYGWNKQHAVGSSSHSLLKTEFPKELSVINRMLAENGTWQGPLLHFNRRGEPVKVLSKWRVLDFPHFKNPLVLELNQPLNSDRQRSFPGAASCAFGAIASELATIASVLNRSLEVCLG